MAENKRRWTHYRSKGKLHAEQYQQLQQSKLKHQLEIEKAYY